MSKESSISVVVRIRPFNENELFLIKQNQEDALDSSGSFKTKSKSRTNHRKVVHTIGDSTLLFDPTERSQFLDRNSNARYSQHCFGQRRNKNITFTYDRVLDENSTQNTVFDQTTKELISDVLRGFNATIFAYGATGCGKTHTILGSQNSPGVVFLGMEFLFDLINKEAHETTTNVTLSYLEVYNESLKDLLLPEGSRAVPLTIRDNTGKSVTVAGLTEHHPKNTLEVMEMISKGNSRRATSATAANAVSSRSHAVLQINVTRKPKNTAEFSKYSAATLNIIDLAGSERASATKNVGLRLREGAKINKSLLALGSCINALAKGSKQHHIPYRESKLTRLLKFSLDGNCKTVMIVCISPSSIYYEETYNALSYAFRAKNIKNTLTQNNNNFEMSLPNCLKVIEALKKELEAYKNTSSAKVLKKENSISEIKEKESAFEEYKNETEVELKSHNDFVLEKIKIQDFIEKLKIRNRLYKAWIAEAKVCGKHENNSLYAQACNSFRNVTAKIRNMNKEEEEISSKITKSEQKITEVIENTKIELRKNLGEDYLRRYENFICVNTSSYELKKLTLLNNSKSESISFILDIAPSLIQINPCFLLESRNQTEAPKSPRKKTATLDKLHQASISSFKNMFSLDYDENNIPVVDISNNSRTKCCISKNPKPTSQDNKKTLTGMNKSLKLRSCISKNPKEKAEKKQVSFNSSAPITIKIISPVKTTTGKSQSKSTVQIKSNKRSNPALTDLERKMKTRRTSLTNPPTRLAPIRRTSILSKNPTELKKLFSKK